MYLLSVPPIARFGQNSLAMAAIAEVVHARDELRGADPEPAKALETWFSQT